MQTKTTNTKSAVLAFYQHYKALGFAVMDSPTHILESGYRYIRSKDAEQYVSLIEAIILRFHPAVVILEDPHSRNKHRWGRMKEIFAICEAHIHDMKYPLVHYDRQIINRTFGKGTKPDIADAIAEAFPEYLSRVPKRRRFDESESPKMTEFDAISLCTTHYSCQVMNPKTP